MRTEDDAINGSGFVRFSRGDSAGMRFLLDPIQETAWAAGVLCTGFTIKLSNNEVTAVIRVKDTKGKAKVAFITAPTYGAVMETWLTALHSTSYSLKWHDDRFA